MVQRFVLFTQGFLQEYFTDLEMSVSVSRNKEIDIIRRPGWQYIFNIIVGNLGFTGTVISHNKYFGMAHIFDLGRIDDSTGSDVRPIRVFTMVFKIT